MLSCIYILSFLSLPPSGRQEIVAHEGAIPELVIDPTNRWFATGSQDKIIRVSMLFDLILIYSSTHSF